MGCEQIKLASFLSVFLNKRKWFFTALSLLFITACIDEITLDSTSNTGNPLVIQGQLIKGDPSSIRVKVSRTANFEAQSLPEPISQANVILHDKVNNSIQLQEVSPGEYELEIDNLNNTMPITIGGSYRIEVALDQGGTYESDFETLQPVPQPDSISIKMIQKVELDDSGNRTTKDFIELFIHTPLLVEGHENGTALRWLFNGVYRVDENPPPPGSLKVPKTCYIPQSLNLDEVAVFKASNTPRLSAFKLMEEEIDHRFSQGYLFTIKQQSLTDEAFEYWNQVSQSVGLSGGLFEATPGRIKSNISNIEDPPEEVLGYFYVSDEIKIRRFVQREEAGIPRGLCGALGRDPNLDLCEDCLLIPASTLIRPAFWKQ